MINPEVCAIVNDVDFSSIVYRVAIARVNGAPGDLRCHKNPYRQQGAHADITKTLALITFTAEREIVVPT